VPTRGVATWYGAHQTYSKHYCFKGFKNTCTPYSTGEKIWYAAVASFSFYAKPYRIRVCRADQPTRCVIVWVRDECAGGCRRDLKKPWTSQSRAVDLSPAAFSRLAPLGKGAVVVTISEVNYPSNSESFNSRVRRGLEH
jgi:hypothetical protein